MFLCVFTTKVAVYLLARVQPGTEIIAFMGAFMAVYGVFFAVFQNDMRRLLSYHIISQVGFMVAGVGILGWLGTANEIGQLGLDGSMAHLFNNILYKALLFMVVGVIIWKTGENLLSRIGGLQKKMPVTAFAFWIAAFSISGIPLFNGYISKGMVLLAAENTSIWIWVLLEIASFGTFLSFLKLGYFAFLRPGDTKATDPPVLMQAAMLGTAALCILIGIFPEVLYAILPYPTTYVAFDPVRIAGTLLILGSALVFFFTIGRKYLQPHDTQLKDFDILYVAAGHGVTVFAGGLQEQFRKIYDIATKATRMLFTAGTYAMAGEGRDINWNLAIFTSMLVGFMIVIMLGVGL